MSPDELASLLEVVAQFGFSSVFLWLFIREANRHDQTRDAYQKDLRELAGLNAGRFLVHTDDGTHKPAE